MYKWEGCTHQHINAHFLNIDYAHDSSHKEDFSNTVVQIQFLTQQCPASFGNLLENANFRAPPQTYWVRSCGPRPTNLFFNLFSDSDAGLSLRTSALVAASSLVGEIRSLRGERTRTPVKWGGGTVQDVLNIFSLLETNSMISHGQTTHFKD